MNLDRFVVRVFKAYADISLIVNGLIVGMPVVISSKPANGLWMNGYMRQNDLVPLMIFLDDIGSNVIKPGEVILEFEDVMVAFDKY